MRYQTTHKVKYFIARCLLIWFLSTLTHPPENAHKMEGVSWLCKNISFDSFTTICLSVGLSVCVSLSVSLSLYVMGFNMAFLYSSSYRIRTLSISGDDMLLLLLLLLNVDVYLCLSIPAVAILDSLGISRWLVAISQLCASDVAGSIRQREIIFMKVTLTLYLNSWLISERGNDHRTTDASTCFSFALVLIWCSFIQCVVLTRNDLCLTFLFYYFFKKSFP